MPLDFQNVSIDLTNGIAQKQNERLAIPTKLAGLSNAEFSEDGSLKQRPGTVRMFDGTVDGAAALTSADFFASFGDEALIGYRDALYSYSSSIGKLVSRGRLPHVSVRKKAVIRNTATQTNVDCANDGANGWTAYCWEDSRGGIRYSVIDSTSGVPLVYDTQVAATGQMPRALITSTYLAIFYVDGANLKVAYCARSTPTAALTVATAASNVHGTVKAMDALVSSGDDIYCAWQNTTPALSRVVYRIGSGAGAAVTVAVANNLGAIALCRTTDAKMLVWHSQATVGMRVLVDSLSSTTITNAVAPTTVDAGIGPGAATQLATIESTTANTAVAYYVTAAGAPNAVIRTGSVTSTGGGAAASEFLLHCQLAGGAFLDGGKIYLPVVFDSAIQGAVFLLETASRSVVARCLPLSGVTTTATYVRLGASFLSGAVRSLPVLEKGRLEVKNGDATTTIGLSRLDFTMDRTEPLPPAAFADSLFLPGACPMAYDGVSAVELGFNVYPESVSPASGGVGNVPAGTRYFAAVYEWTDAKGRRHQSPPSLSVAYTNAGATSVTVTLQTLSLTDKYDNSGLSLKPVARTNANIAVYVTEAGGTVFYRSGSVANNPLGATVAFTHNITDTALIAGEVLYDATNAGTFDSFAPPACRAACVHQNQLVVLGCEDERALYYSRPLADGSGPSFDLERRLRVPEDEGGVVAAETFDSKLAAWTDSAAGWFPGEAPNAAGQGAGYGDWQVLSEEVGCIDPRSVIFASGALWFQGESGIHALGADGSVQFIGADVSDSTTAVTATAFLPSRKQVFFFQGTASTLVFDTFWKQWSVYGGYGFAPQYGTVGASVRNGRLEWGVGDGTADYADGAVGSDLGSGAIAPAFTTAWIKLAGVQGFQRVRNVLLVGSIMGGTSANVFWGFDLDYVANTVYFLDGVDVGKSDPWQRRDHAGRKCEAIRFRFSASGNTGLETISLQNLTLEVGLKRGGFKMART